jgi:hypothetical protein
MESDEADYQLFAESLTTKRKADAEQATPPASASSVRIYPGEGGRGFILIMIAAFKHSRPDLDIVLLNSKLADVIFQQTSCYSCHSHQS